MTTPEELTCLEVVELVTDYLEHALDPVARRVFEEHLKVCDGCEVFLDQMRTTIANLGRVPLSTLSDEAVSTLVEAFRGMTAP